MLTHEESRFTLRGTLGDRVRVTTHYLQHVDLLTIYLSFLALFFFVLFSFLQHVSGRLTEGGGFFFSFFFFASLSFSSIFLGSEVIASASTQF
jgi:hypothetical protein